MAKTDNKIYYCIGCGKTHAKNEFYKSYNPIHKNGVYPFCKKYIKDFVYDPNGKVNLDKFKYILMQMDAPFIEDIWEITLQEEREPIGIYFKNINMKQNRGLTWRNSSFKEDDNQNKKQSKDEIIITPETRKRWGENYNDEQIIYLESFYRDMHMAYSIVTPQHEKALIMICKLQLKMDECLEQGDMVTFSKIHQEYQKLLQSSGLRPIDKIGKDEAMGIRSFSQIFEEVEKDGFIKPAPIKENQDIVDKTIQYIMDYTLRLLNQQTLTEPPPDTPKVEEDKAGDGDE